MIFQVFYSIDWSLDEGERCPVLNGEHAAVMERFYAPRPRIVDGVYFASMSSKGSLDRKEFEAFLRHTQMTPVPDGVDKTFLGGVPYIKFVGDGRPYRETAKVVPTPGPDGRQFEIDPLDPFGLAKVVTQREEYRMQAWKRVKRAILNTYKNGVT